VPPGDPALQRVLGLNGLPPVTGFGLVRLKGAALTAKNLAPTSDGLASNFFVAVGAFNNFGSLISHLGLSPPVSSIGTAQPV